jgi:hypothetical protein
MACKVCNISTGFARNCDLRVSGGSKSVTYFIESESVTAYTFNGTNSEILDSVTLAAGKSWYTIEAFENTVQPISAFEQGNSFTTETITMTIPRYSDNPNLRIAAAEHKRFLDQIKTSDCGWLMAVADRAGVYRLYGFTASSQNSDGLYGAFSDDPGLAVGDQAGTALTFTSQSALSPVPLAASFVFA